MTSAYGKMDRFFDYSVPEEFEKIIMPGMRAEVPFGKSNKRTECMIVRLLLSQNEINSTLEYKSIIRLLDDKPVITLFDIEAAWKLKKRCLCTYAEALKLFVPPGSGMKYEEMIHLTGDYAEEDLFKMVKKSILQEIVVKALLEAGGSMTYTALLRQTQKKSLRTTSKALCEKGLIRISHISAKSAHEKTVRLVYYCGELSINETIDHLSYNKKAQKRVLEVLRDLETVSVTDLLMLAETTHSVLNTMQKAGLIGYEEKIILRKPIQPKEESSKPPRLTTEQTSAVGLISSSMGKHEVFVLHGVTGSGKTEVFLRIIQKALNQKKTALMLVPEIALTPQMTERFTARFGDRVAILHSALSIGERYDEWQRIKNGEATVVIGTRSAVFAPLSKIGVIVIDEEHETTYKSEMPPRYDARFAALIRAKQMNSIVVLASATPSIESYARAKFGEYTLISMENRVNKSPLPEVKIVDMREELENGNRSIISRALLTELKDNVERGEQSILFLNRRGFATFVSCRSCGEVMSCPNCSISLTYHRFNHTLSCHYCGYRKDIPQHCPTCGSDHIRYFGKGTEKLEDELSTLLPGVPMLRLDNDTTVTKQSHEKILSKFQKENIPILMGTQMVAKGLDFPNVTLVGVIAADSELFADNYTASERTFDLLTQVFGRAGRAEKKGRAIVQTYQPEHPVIQLAAEQDYVSFFNSELMYRSSLSYPPYSDIIHFVFSGLDENEVKVAAVSSSEKARMLLKMHGLIDEVSWFEASPAPVARIDGKYRYRYWIKGKLNKNLIEILENIMNEHYNNKNRAKVYLSVDVNPFSMQ